MYLPKRAVWAVVALGITAQSGPACTLDSYLFQLPGETEIQARERADRVSSDHDAIEQYDSETYYFKHAPIVYVGRVEAKTQLKSIARDNLVLPSTRVRPIKALKGTLPSGERTLIDEMRGGRCLDIGDGSGAHADIGSLVIVFEGMPIDDPIDGERPRGINSFPATEIRSYELLERLREFGKELNDRYGLDPREGQSEEQRAARDAQRRQTDGNLRGLRK